MASKSAKPEKGTAEAVAAEQEEMQEAAESVEAEKEKVAGLKSTPKDSEAPTERTTSGEQKYSRERLIEESYAFVDQPPHVVAGALALSGKAYLSRDETKAAVEKFLNTESYTTPITPETPPEE